jgi:hypothetical protein
LFPQCGIIWPWREHRLIERHLPRYYCQLTNLPLKFCVMWIMTISKCPGKIGFVDFVRQT